MSNRQDAAAQYNKALHMGQRCRKRCMAQGEYPYPQTLNDILPGADRLNQVPIGLMEIPVELIVGTREAGRTQAFSKDFMPLLPADSEFATKWINLCEAHLGSEGIRDPILCYEYLGRFYIREGNKRLSVLKSYGAATIPSVVTRILPAASDDTGGQAYEQFMKFFPRIGLYQVQFSNSASYGKLQAALGFSPDHIWSDPEKKNFLAQYHRFRAAVRPRIERERLPMTVADALLFWLEVYSFETLENMGKDELSRTINGIWPSIRLNALRPPISVSMSPAADKAEAEKWGLPKIPIMNSGRKSRLHIAFIHWGKAGKSAWTMGHEMGRIYLENNMGDKIHVQRYICNDTASVIPGETPEAVMEKAVADGANMLIATAPPLIRACLKIAAKYPNIYILNCSLSMPYAGVRTYYSRMYEGKFIAGAVAAAVSRAECIGYIANYPILGTPASINAFALGARMVNPKVRIALRWSCLPGNPEQDFLAQNIQVISSRESTAQEYLPWASTFGTNLYLTDGTQLSLCDPCWDWGQFYVRMTELVLSGGWKLPEEKGGEKAVNYWWGMNSGVVDVRLPDTLPDGVRQMASILRDGLTSGGVDPFHCWFLDQNGVLRNDGNSWLSPEQIMNMDYLCENVDGSIPDFSEILPMSQDMVRLLGIHRENIPPLPKDSQPTAERS